MQARPGTPDTFSRIALVGFMGAGKSTIGPLLASHLGWRFEDSDHRIERETGTTIADLFSRFGESSFRIAEEQAIAGLHRERQIVLALGGGALESEATRSLLAGSAETLQIFLRAPLPVLVDRCMNQPNASIRPILQQQEALLDRFHSRLRYYEQAHLIAETEGLTPDQISRRILNQLHLDGSTILLKKEEIHS